MQPGPASHRQCFFLYLLAAIGCWSLSIPAIAAEPDASWNIPLGLEDLADYLPEYALGLSRGGSTNYAKGTQRIFFYTTARVSHFAKDGNYTVRHAYTPLRSIVVFHVVSGNLRRRTGHGNAPLPTRADTPITIERARILRQQIMNDIPLRNGAESELRGQMLLQYGDIPIMRCYSVIYTQAERMLSSPRAYTLDCLGAIHGWFFETRFTTPSANGNRDERAELFALLFAKEIAASLLSVRTSSLSVGPMPEQRSAQ